MPIEVIEIISKYTEVSKENINTDTQISVLSIDSLKFVSLIVELEEYYEKEMEDESLDFSIYETVGDILIQFTKGE